MKVLSLTTFMTTEAPDIVDLVSRLPHQLTGADPLQTPRTLHCGHCEEVNNYRQHLFNSKHIFY